MSRRKPATALHVRDYYPTCGTRARGKEFFAVLQSWFEALPSRSKATVSFAGVEYVSPSFLDETLVRLLEDRPAARSRLIVEALQPMAERQFRRMSERASA